MKRVKASTVLPIGTKAEFESVVDEIAKMQLEIDADIATHNEAAALAEENFKTELKAKNAGLLQKIIIAQMYAKLHRGDLLGEKQSSETNHADYGFRKSPGILKKLNSKWTAKKTIEALLGAGKKACVKVKASLDKQAVKKEIPEADLANYGLRMVFPEEFWVEAKREVKPADKRLTA